VAVLSNTQASWNAFCCVVSGWPGPVRWAWAASRPDDGGWRLEHFAARAPASVEPVRFRYGDAALVVESLSPRAAAKRLRAGAVAAASTLGTSIDFGPTPAKVYVNRLSTEQDRIILHENAWPEIFASVMFQSARQTPAGLLATPGKRFFASWEAALGELVFERPISATQIHQQPSGIIRLADERARLADLGASADAVSATVVSDRSDLRGWTMRATWRSQAEDPTWRHADIGLTAPGGIVIDVEAVPYEFTVLLIDEHGHAVDRRAWSTSQ
jgi:hypothetical protein